MRGGSPHDVLNLHTADAHSWIFLLQFFSTDGPDRRMSRLEVGLRVLRMLGDGSDGGSGCCVTLLGGAEHQGLVDGAQSLHFGFG